tara:strand:+ start:8732 stop:9157 length:426 start_codon:yes stop_codon:yes gene_type:complete
MREKIKSERIPSVLIGYLESKMSEPFCYGKNDCCLFAAKWVELVTGENPAQEFGIYESKKEAFKILTKSGGVRGICKKLFKRIHLNDAQRGDLVTYIEKPGRAKFETALGILEGRYGFFVTEQGLRPIERSNLQKTAWRIF